MRKNDVQAVSPRLSEDCVAVGGCRNIVVHGNSMLPLYRHGDQLIVSKAASVRTGDRVSVETKSGETHGGTLVLQNEKVIQIARGGSLRRDLTLKVADVRCVSRILWASQ